MSPLPPQVIISKNLVKKGEGKGRMAPKKGSKTPQTQISKKDKVEGNSRNTLGTQSVQTTDVKEFFQQLHLQSPHATQELQTAQELSNLAESLATSRSSGEEQVGHPRNSSPIEKTGPISKQKEEYKEKWDIKAYIRSLPTRADMDQYVHRLEESYKIEIQELKTSTKITQEKIDTVDKRVSKTEQELKRIGEKIQKQKKQFMQNNKQFR